jgi:hypothetical protein
MSSDPPLPNLHDAVLERIDLRWEPGQATIELTRVPGGPLKLVASGLRGFSMTRRQEWGPSVFVNNAQARVDGQDGIVLEIEMQSGDTIIVAAHGLSVA